MDLFGIDGDHRGGRRRWTGWAWPLLGGLVGALLGVLAAPPLVRALERLIGPDQPWLLPALLLAIPLATVLAFIVLRRDRRD